MDMILDAIDQGLKNKGLSDSAASKLAVGHPSLIKNFRMPREGEKRYNVGALEKLAEVLDLEFYFGPPRSISPPAVNGFAETAAKLIEPSIDGSPGALRIGYLPIPFGEGDRSHSGAAPIAIARSWLNDHGLQPDNLYFYIVQDNRMASALSKGSLALINTRAGRAGHYIWACIEAGKLFFARLAWPGENQLMISFDDHAQPPVLKTVKQAQSISVLGKVIWSGRDIPS